MNLVLFSHANAGQQAGGMDLSMMQVERAIGRAAGQFFIWPKNILFASVCVEHFSASKSYSLGQSWSLSAKSNGIEQQSSLSQNTKD